MSETGDTDTLAAEYVLGTLDANERAQAQALLTVDQALAAKVRIWERRLSELHLMVEPIEPEPEIWDRIKRRVPQPAARVAQAAAVAPLAAVAAVAEAAFVSAPAPVSMPAPEPSPPAGPAPWPALANQPAPAKRPTLESLEEAVLRAADDLQQRATAEAAVAAAVESETAAEPAVEPAAEPAAAETAAAPVAEPAPEPADAPAAGAEPAEADGRSAEAAGSGSEQAQKSAEEGPKTEETPAPATATDKEPAPGGVAGDTPEPTPFGPLAAFPTAFTASAPVPAPAPLVPSSSATVLVPPPPPLPPPTPGVPVLRPENRARTPAPKSRWLARTIATLATLILLAAAGLVAAWRFAPERVPLHLQPVELLRAAGIAVPTVVVGPPPRKPAPPESQYDE